MQDLPISMQDLPISTQDLPFFHSRLYIQTCQFQTLTVHLGINHVYYKLLSS